MDKVLITGGSGFVGQNLAQFFEQRGYSVVTTYLGHPTASAASLDVRDQEAVLKFFDQVQPDFVVHAAGIKDVRFCEEHPDEAYQTNALGARNVARACRRVGARLIHISTDLVFAGVEGNYTEDDVPQPSLVYGKTKLEGERMVREELDDVAVCRSAGVYGHGSPLLRWLSAELQAGRSVKCFTDVFNSPTYAVNLGEMIEAILLKELTGVFHTAGRERVNRWEFFHTYAKSLELDADLLVADSAKVSGALLLQPDSSLSVNQTAARLGMVFNSVAEGCARLRENR